MTIDTFHCSMCGRRIKVQTRPDLPIFDPGTGFGICKNCVKNIYHWIEDEESKRGGRSSKKGFYATLGNLLEKNNSK